MSESESREILVLLCECGEAIDNDGKFREDEIAAFAEKDEVCVVGHIARCGAEVDNGSSSRSDEAKCMDVGHDIVSAFLFFLGGDLELFLVEILWGCSKDIL